MRRTDFLYDLPPDLIAQAPLAERSGSRLLCLGEGKALDDRTVRELPKSLRAGDLLILNDTRVMNARLIGKRPTGGRVEFLVERLTSPTTALAHGRASKPMREGAQVDVEGTLIQISGREGALYVIELRDRGDFETLMRTHGQVPLPPYIERGADTSDSERYQTVYARELGAVAAPTAGLHFDEALLSSVRACNVRTAFVTLHVGAGTFQPVREEDLEQHTLHSERYRIPAGVVQDIAVTQREGGRVVAVGTTVVRALESAALSGTLLDGEHETQLFIRPGFPFRVCDALLTNFHLPASTLLMLVCAFGGYERVMRAYRHAVDARYRFFSYGDAMWLERSRA